MRNAENAANRDLFGISIQRDLGDIRDEENMDDEPVYSGSQTNF